MRNGFFRIYPKIIREIEFAGPCLIEVYIQASTIDCLMMTKVKLVDVLTGKRLKLKAQV